MNRNIMIILNAIAFSLNGYSYTGPKKGSRWGKLEIGNDDETQTIMTVFEDDFAWASKLIDITRDVPYRVFSKFWYDQTMVLKEESGRVKWTSPHRVISSTYLDWIEETAKKLPGYKLTLAKQRVIQIAQTSCDSTIGNTTKQDWIDQFKEEPYIIEELNKILK